MWFSWEVITAKWAWFYYDWDVTEYSLLSMLISGLVALLSIIPIMYYGTPLQTIFGSSLSLSIAWAIIAGVLTTLGHWVYFTAVSCGSVEIAQLFANMKTIVHLAEEVIFMSFIPDIYSLLGVAIAVTGGALVIFGENKIHKNKVEIDSSK